KLRVLGHLDTTAVGIATRVFGEDPGVVGVIAYYPDKSVAIRDTPGIREYATTQSLTLAPAAAGDRDPIKILALCTSKEAVASLQEKLRTQLAAHGKDVNISGRSLDIAPAGIDKLTGIREAL